MLPIRKPSMGRKSGIKLSSNLFEDQLPKICQSKFSPKNKNLLQNILQLSSKKLKQSNQNIFNNNDFSLPKSFTKHNNIVQTNTLNVLNVTVQRHKQKQKSQIKTPIQQIQSFCNQKKQNYERRSTYNKLISSTFHRTPTYYKTSTYHCRKNSNCNFFQPNTLISITQKFQKIYQQKQKSQITQQEPFKSNLKASSYIRKQQKDKKQFLKFLSLNRSIKINRTTLLQLKSYYNSLLTYSKDDTTKFKHSFQIMLNLVNLTARQSMIDQSVKQLLCGGFDFDKFIRIFMEIQEKLKKQTVIDSFQILFEEIHNQQFNYDDMLKTFMGRMKNQIAMEMVELIYQCLNKDINQIIKKKDIYKLCYENQYFCNRFLTLYNESMIKKTYHTHQK